MNYTIHPLTQEDEPFLWEMLYQAIYVPEGHPRPPRNIVHQPGLSSYVAGWGRAGDCGFLARGEDMRPIGAIWLRLPQVGQPGYGYVDDETPELSLALLPDYRGQGIGTQLFNHLFASPCMHPKVSLSVSAKNPARRLYERVGFVEIKRSDESLTMMRIEATVA